MKKKSLQGLLGLLTLLGAGLLSLAPGAKAQSSAPARVLLPLALSGWSQTLLPLPIVPGGSPVSSEEHFDQLRRGSIFVDFYAPNSAQALATMESREGQVRQTLLDLLGDTPMPVRSVNGGGSVTLPPVTVGGVTYNARGSIQQINSNGSYGMDLQTDTTLPDGESISFKDAFSGDFGVCPDAGGVFQGTVSGEALMSGSQIDGNVRTIFRYQESLEATVTAHVGMDARVSHYDLDGAIVIETNIQERQADNGQLIANHTEVFRSRLTGSHLNPRSDDLSAAQLAWQVWGPGGAVAGGLTGGVLRAEVSEAILELSAKAVGIADAYLLEAETGWYDEAKCVSLTFNPRHLTLAPAASGSLAVSLKGKDDNNEVEANMTVTIDHGASVTPENASSAPGAPADFTLTAPGQPWESPNNPVLRVEATSRRGRAVDLSWIEMEEAIIVVDLHGGSQASYPVDENFTFIMFTDEDARSVIVTNPYASGVATVTAFLHYETAQGNDVYVDEDWSDRPARVFCRDIRAERIADIELWVQFAPGVTPDPSVRPQVTATNIGCWRWQGTATIRSRERPYAGVDIADHTTATVTFERTRLYDITAPYMPEFYRPIQGSVEWRRWGVLGECSYAAGPATQQIRPDDGTLAIYNYLIQGPERRTYSASAETELRTTEALTCPSGTTTSLAEVTRSWLSPPAEEVTQVEPAGDVIYFLYAESSGGIETTYEWELVALRQP